MSEDEGREGTEGKGRVIDWIVVMGHQWEMVCKARETINSSIGSTVYPAVTWMIIKGVGSATKCLAA